MKSLHRFVILIVVCVVGVSGCALTDSFKSPEKIANEYADIIMDCFKTGETERLEKVFCEKSRTGFDIKTQLEEAIDFIDGNIIDEGKKFAMTDSQTYWEGGIKTLCSISPSIKEILTDTGKKYSIAYHGYVVYKDNNSYVGLTMLKVIDKTDKSIPYGTKPEVEVGYLWR